MSPAPALAARCRDLLGRLSGPVLATSPRAPAFVIALRTLVPLADAGDIPTAAVIDLRGTRAAPTDRQALLASVCSQLPAGAPLVLVDHNQPRRLLPRLLAAARLALRGLPPARARYPAARELAALGFSIDRLRLACGERVQLVAAHKI